MITVECIGKLKNDNVSIDFIKNIYKDNTKLGNFSEEFCSTALSVLNDELNIGDKFRIKILNYKNNIIKDDYYIFNGVKGGSLYYNEWYSRKIEKYYSRDEYD